MIRRLQYIIFIFILSFAFNAFAQPTIDGLIDNSKQYDSKKVLVEGEAIGHLMARGDHAWFNMNDGTASIGIWIDLELAGQLKHFGRHAVKGDQVRVDGVFNSDCFMHGGDTDIHASSMVVVKKGSAIQLTHDQNKVNILVFLIGLMVCLYIIKTLKRKH